MSENKVLPAYSSPETDRFLWPDECPPPRGQKLLIYTSGGVSIVSDWSDDSNHVAWRPLPRKPARQCPSCGGFCSPRGCERENDKPAPIASSAWKLVPTEPTDAMLDAMQESALVSFDAAIEAELNNGPAVESLHKVVYRAMLAAAPEAPSAEPALTCECGRQWSHLAGYGWTVNAASDASAEPLYTFRPEGVRITAQTGWIACEERMPDEGEVVAVLTSCGQRFTAWPTHWRGASSGFAQWTFPSTDMDGVTVTHWMPLPETPKEAK